MRHHDEQGATAPFSFLCCDADDPLPVVRSCWANTALAAAMQFCQLQGRVTGVMVGTQHWPARTIRIALSGMPPRPKKKTRFSI